MKRGTGKVKVLVGVILLVVVASALLHVWNPSETGPLEELEPSVDDESPNGEEAYPETVSLETAWSRDFGSPFDDPVELGDRDLYVAPRGRSVHRLDGSTGEDVWSREFDGRVWGSSLKQDDGDLFVGVEGEGLYCLDAESGEELWRVPVHGEAKFEPLVTGDSVYVVTTFVGHLIEGPILNESTVYKLRRSGGDVAWEAETDNYLLRKPVLDEEHVYVGGSYMGEDAPEEGGLTRIYALDEGSGDEAWRYESPDGLIKDMHLNGGTLAFLGYTDYIHGLDTDTGEKVWEFYTGNWVPGFIGEGRHIYFGAGHGFVYSLDVQTGEPRWEFDINGTFNAPIGSPWIDGDHIVYNTKFEEIHVLDKETGEASWIAEAPIKSRTTVKRQDETFYYPGREGTLLAFEYTGS